jgi:hypothetical protein
LTFADLVVHPNLDPEENIWVKLSIENRCLLSSAASQCDLKKSMDTLGVLGFGCHVFDHIGDRYRIGYTGVPKMDDLTISFFWSLTLALP